MVEKIQFIAEKVQEAEAYYSQLKISPTQSKVVTGLSEEISQHIPLSDRAIKGFFWRIAREYQMKHHQAANEAENATPAERVKALGEMFTMLKKELTRTLVDKEHEPLLDQALNKAMSVYKEKYADR